jgi:hypothetical protein
MDIGVGVAEEQVHDASKVARTERREDLPEERAGGSVLMQEFPRMVTDVELAILACRQVLACFSKCIPPSTGK